MPHTPIPDKDDPLERLEQENDLAKEADQAIYGTSFQDAFGKRIDPSTVRPVYRPSQ